MSTGGAASVTARTVHHRDYPVDELLAVKGTTTVAMCVPARNEEATIGATVEALVALRRTGLVDEVVVVDDGSSDATADISRAAGATVRPTGSVAGPGTGKGEALWTSLHATSADVVAWCDADISDFDERFVTGLVGPLLTDDDVDFVKAFYERSVDGHVGGGRVTELLARPLITLLHPALLAFHQPLGGEFAGRRDLLESLPFVTGYGVDLALLIDVVDAVGLERTVQVDLGTRTHRHRSLTSLRPTAVEVLHAGLRRAGVDVPPEVTCTDAELRLAERPPIRRDRSRLVRNGHSAGDPASGGGGDTAR
ncbi:MAG: glucosyl-3-phosphoglycerate synthase [Actinomycetota bacterium]|nr:glucosyl-3-phosphoglycerate synthase [Actinomycetota bacterium]